MKAILVIALVVGAFTVQAFDAQAISQKAQASKSKKNEPAPRDGGERRGSNEDRDPRQGTFEGNDRNDGGSFDGGGYTGGSDDGGFAGEIFSTVNSGRTYPSKTATSVEDRGDVLVYTTTLQEDLSASETCVTTIVSVVDKATGKSLKTDSDRFCNVIGY